MKETQEYLDALEIVRRYHKKEPVKEPKECDVCKSKRLRRSKRNKKLYCLDCKHSKPF